MHLLNQGARAWSSAALGAFLLSACAAPASETPAAAPGVPRSRADELNAARRAIDAPSERRVAAADEPRWIGVQLKQTPDNAGVLVLAVFPNSPAERAGVLGGDVLLQLNGVAVGSPEGVVEVVAKATTLNSLSLVLRRANAEHLLRVDLEPLPSRDQLMRQGYLGRAAPAWEELATVRGSVDPDLAEQRGRVVVLEFWASWCGVCRYLTPVLNDWASRYGAQGAEVVGVIADPVEQGSAAARDFEIEYAVFADPTGKTSVAYRATVIPTVFLIDQRGVVRDVMVGFSSDGIRTMQRNIEALLDGAGAPAATTSW